MNSKKITEKELIKLYAVFKEAAEHLSYCNYGDSYEKECAKDSGLIKRINNAIIEFKEFDIEEPQI